jgi:hypothetical protein
MEINNMNYRDMLGFSKKRPKKKVEKRVAPKPTAPPVTELLKKEFGPLNEWGKVNTGPKRWTKDMDGSTGLTEFERKGGKDNVNEGPAYEYAKFIKKIEKSRDSFGKDVLNFYELLRKKGLDDEAHDLLDDYKKYVIKFGLKFKKFVRTLL